MQTHIHSANKNLWHSRCRLALLRGVSRAISSFTDSSSASIQRKTAKLSGENNAIACAGRSSGITPHRHQSPQIHHMQPVLLSQRRVALGAPRLVLQVSYAAVGSLLLQRSGFESLRLQDHQSADGHLNEMRGISDLKFGDKMYCGAVDLLQLLDFGQHGCIVWFCCGAILASVARGEPETQSQQSPLSRNRSQATEIVQQGMTRLSQLLSRCNADGQLLRLQTFSPS